MRHRCQLTNSPSFSSWHHPGHLQPEFSWVLVPPQLLKGFSFPLRCIQWVKTYCLTLSICGLNFTPEKREDGYIFIFEQFYLWHQNKQPNPSMTKSYLFLRASIAWCNFSSWKSSFKAYYVFARGGILGKIRDWASLTCQMIIIFTVRKHTGFFILIILILLAHLLNFLY